MDAQGISAEMIPDKLDTLRPTFSSAWPIDEAPFSELLLFVIDEAEQEMVTQQPANDVGVNSVMQVG